MPDFLSAADQKLAPRKKSGTFQITAVSLGLAAGMLVFGIASLPEGPAIAGADRSQQANHSIHIPIEGLDPSHAAINQALNLLKSEVVTLELPAEPGAAFEVATAMDAINGGEPITLQLWPHTVRDPQFRVLTQIEGGALVEVDPGPERTLRGRIVEAPGSQIAGSLFETGLSAMIVLPDGVEMWIEPLAEHLKPGAFAPGEHVVYEPANAVGEPGTCGVTNQFIEAHGQGNGDSGDGGGVAGSVVCVKIGIDADFQYYQQYGSSVTNVTNQVSNIVNTANNQYENEVGIKHVITEIIIRTSSADNPYTTNSASGLLNEFRDEWNTQPEWSIDRNVAHLFTGRNLSGSTIGIAFLNTMCSKSNAYGLSQNITGAFFWKTDLFAHEIGHNWNANHCSCNQTTMNPSITGANTFIGPGSNSVTRITNKKNAVSCPTNCIPDPPQNDTCPASINVLAGDTPISNLGATTNGPTEPLCDFSGSSQIESDVWYRHTAQCTGTLFVRLCNSQSGIDTKLAVYNVTCPTGPGTAIACNKDHCGQRSAVTVQAVAGQTYRIRVGSHDGAQGDLVLTVVCVADPDPDPCPADLTGDGNVGVPDLLELLAVWGACADPDNCPADLTDSGTVGVPDLLILLAAWGPCP